MLTRILTSILIGMLSPMTAWIGGHDFVQREPINAAVLGGFLFLFMLSVTCPAWYDGESND